MRIANHHFVTPALWCALERKAAAACIPGDAREFLQLAHRQNLERNRKLRQQAFDVTALLNARGVEPIVLKGGAHIVETPGENAGDVPGDVPGDRMMIDLDFLVPARRFDDSVDALKSAGFAPVGELEGWTYQYPPLVRAGDVAAVEIHRDVGEQKAMIANDAAFAEAVRLAAGGLALWALSPTHRVVHNVFHSRIQDRNHELGVISLKHLTDFATLWQRHDRQIDWDKAARTLKAHGLETMWETHLFLARRLLDIPAPQTARHTRRVRWHYQRCLLQMRWDWLMSLVNAWAAVTHPFQKCHIDYIYGCGDNPLSRAYYRAVHGSRLLRKYKLAIFREIKTARGSFYDAN